jgi:hypothetical protein
MKQLQLHELLGFLAAGVRQHELSEFERRSALNKARALWPATGLEDWDAHPRSVPYAWMSNDGRHIAPHVTADHENCFVILVQCGASDVGWLVYDIGAEYRGAYFVCPSAGIDGPAEREAVLAALPALRDGDWAVLDRGEGTYLQAFREADGSYVLEHQLVTPRSLYRAASPLDADAACRAFVSYGFERKEWAVDIDWARLDSSACDP